MSLLALSGVRRSFGEGALAVEVLRGIDVLIEPGEMVALIGPSGSGKGTLLNIRGLLDRATSGEVEVGGRAVTKLDDEGLTQLRGEALGFIFQLHHPIDPPSVPEYVMMPSAALAGGFTGAMEPKARALLEAVGLGDRTGAWPRELSGGMQQRVAIARALMNDPDVILLDEPSEGLAPLVVRDVFHQVQALRDEGLSVVLAEQNLDFVLDLADRVYILEKGQVKWSGTAAEVRADTDLQKRYLTV